MKMAYGYRGSSQYGVGRPSYVRSKAALLLASCTAQTSACCSQNPAIYYNSELTAVSFDAFFLRGENLDVATAGRYQGGRCRRVAKITRKFGKGG